MAEIVFDRKVNIRIYSGDTEYVINSTSDYGITSGSMSLNEILCDSELEFGSLSSNKFEVQIFGIDVDLTGYNIVVTCEDKTPIFVGKIESSETDNFGGYRDIIAYDEFYFCSTKNVAPWWTTFWSTRTSATMQEIRESLCSYMAFTYDITSLPNDSLTVSKANSFTSLKFSDIMKMICELQGTIPNINRSGSIEFVSLSTTATAINEMYETANSTFEDYVTDKITGVKVYDSSSNLSQAVGDETNAYIISGNIFLLSMTAENITTACTTLLNAIKDIQYKPCEIPLIISDLTLTLGTKITTDRGTHYIMSQECSGSLLVEQTVSCVAYGQKLNDEPSSYNDELITGAKFSSIEQNIDSIVTQVGEQDGRLTKTEQTVEGLTTTISDIDGNVLKIQATIDGLTITDAQGNTLINGGRIETSDLFLSRLWSKDSTDSYIQMQDAGLDFVLGKSDAVGIGYTLNTKTSPNSILPYIVFGTTTGAKAEYTGMVKKFDGGLWVGNGTDKDSMAIESGTGLYIDLDRNKLYKYIDGEGHEIADSDTLVAVFG